MKKNLITAILALTMVSAFSANWYTVVKVVKTPKVRDCIIFEIKGTVLKGTEVKDEKGSTYIHLDFVPFEEHKVLYIENNKVWWATLNKNGSNYSINGTGPSKYSFRVINPNEGYTKGFMTITSSVSGKGVGVPSVSCVFSCETENEYDDVTGKYSFKSGSGTFTGNSYPTGQALVYTAPAVIPTEMMAPAWGTFKVYRKSLLDDEIIELLK